MMERALQWDASMRRILWIAVAAASGCAVDPIPVGDSCVDHHEETIEIQTPADPPMELRIESCQLDLDACQAVCDMAMSRHGISETSTSCGIAFEPLSIAVHVAYDTDNGGNGCAVPESGTSGGSGQTNGV